MMHGAAAAPGAAAGSAASGADDAFPEVLLFDWAVFAVYAEGSVQRHHADDTAGHRLRALDRH